MFTNKILHYYINIKTYHTYSTKYIIKKNELDIMFVFNKKSNNKNTITKQNIFYQIS